MGKVPRGIRERGELSRAESFGGPEETRVREVKLYIVISCTIRCGNYVNLTVHSWISWNLNFATRINLAFSEKSDDGKFNF